MPADPNKRELRKLKRKVKRAGSKHRRRDLLAQIYPGMKKNVQWWITDRDPDGNGLFEIDHQLETGMDDLIRRWHGPRPPRYEAVDATVYAYLNLRAVANMARELGHDEDARELYVADGYGNRRIVVFDMNTGAFKRGWGAYGMPLGQIENGAMPAYNPGQSRRRAGAEVSLRPPWRGEGDQCHR